MSAVANEIPYRTVDSASSNEVDGDAIDLVNEVFGADHRWKFQPRGEEVVRIWADLTRRQRP